MSPGLSSLSQPSCPLQTRAEDPGPSVAASADVATLEFAKLFSTVFKVGILIAFFKCHFCHFLILRVMFQKVADLGLPLLAAQISETE